MIVRAAVGISLAFHAAYYRLYGITFGKVSNKGDRTRAIAGRVADWIAVFLPLHPDEGGLAARQRDLAGDVLAAIGDPRFDPHRHHLPADELLGFVRIAADPAFRIGTRAADRERIAEIVDRNPGDDEINDAPTPTPEFYIARHPVTVAQFRAFVDATQYELEDHDALCALDPSSRPVRWVTWHEAQAYCSWLNGLLADSPALDGNPIARLVREGGWRVDLPSELEWEKAARGGLSDKVFPWGDTPDPDRANYSDSGIGGTSAVGCFPANGYGLHDMIGNVGELTRSRYASYPYRAGDGREDPDPGVGNPMVVRGGSWNYGRDFARCASRYGTPLDSRSGVVGFRVVLRSAPVRSGR